MSPSLLARGVFGDRTGGIISQENYKIFLIWIKEINTVCMRPLYGLDVFELMLSPAAYFSVIGIKVQANSPPENY